MADKSGLMLKCAAAALFCLAGGSFSFPSMAAPEPVDGGTKAPRLIVITDIGTEPDDMESMIRLLTYSNELEIEALIASTSNHLRDKIYPFLIEERIDAYGDVLPNLRVHDPRYPDAATLRASIAAHRPIYGMEGVGDGLDTDASRRIIAAVDKADPRPVWVSIWGGAAPLAQALHSVRGTRSPEEVARFVAKLRVYSISDQDDAGPWIRKIFPDLFWIASIHAPTQYELAAWTGISADVPGANAAVVSRTWLSENVRKKGPLGAAYPVPMFIMEGDTPSFLYLIPNGLGVPEHPDWGSWGGRYGRLSADVGLWTDIQDTVSGTDGETVHSNKVTVSRWREAFQNDFAARMAWSVTSRFGDANHPPEPFLDGTGGTAPLRMRMCPGGSMDLSAAGSSDPDGDTLSYDWSIYREVTGNWYPPSSLSRSTGQKTTFTVPEWKQLASLPLRPSYDFHVILSVTDDGAPALTRYRRAVVTVPTGSSDCPAIRQTEETAPIVPGSTIRTVSDYEASGFSTDASALGDLVTNPATRAVLDQFVPGLAAQIERSPQAQGMTLSAVSHFDPRVTPEVLKAIDARFAQIPEK